MKHILISFLVSIIVFTDGYAAPLKGADLFTNPTNSYVQLSPDGKLLSYIESTKKTKQLVLFDTVNDEVHSSINIGLNNRLQKYHWLNSDVLLIDIQKGGLSFLLSAVVTGRTPELKMHNFRGNVISLLPNQPDKILFALHKKHYFQTLLLVPIDDFLRGDFSDAEYTEFGVDDVLAYSYDHVAQKLFLSTYDNKKMLATFYWQELGDDDVHKFLELEEFEDFFKPVHFLDENRLAVLTNKKTDKIVLQEFWIDSQSLGEIIYSHEMYDLREASYDQGNKLFSVGYYEHGIYQRSFFKKSNSIFAKRLGKTFPGKGVYIIDSSLDRKKMVLQVAGANEPGTYYLYKEGSDTARILMSRHPQLDDIVLSKNERLIIKVDSGTQLEAYLTLPSDNHHSTLLVYPHGGPIGVRETDYYRPEVQYLVSRGFSVLRVNFRGSSGFGKAFESKGVGQFGKLIEDDIMSAVNQVLEKHTFEHICSMGASYGGYSSAMLAIKRPDLFECVVASFGIYDLPLLFNESNVKQRDSVLKAVSNVVGEFSKELKYVSPVYLAENHKAPILLIAGRKDKVASFEHTNRFKYMLQRHGNTPETMFYDNTGHGHTNWSYDHHEAALVFDFLTRTLNLEISHLTSEPESQQAIAEDYLKLADKLTFKDNVPDNNGKAFEYLQKAAHLNAPRALFNIGANYQTGEHFEKNIDRAIAYYKKAGKLGYERADLRLGRLYMQGYLVQKNWELAQEYLNKAQETKEENFAQIHLGQFYCLAPSPLQDIDRCLELLDMKRYKEKSNPLRERAFRQLEKSLAWMIVEGNYSAEDKQKITNFITEEYNITHLDAEIDDLELGVFAYGEKEKYSERNEYILREDADLNKITPAKNIKIGMRFDPDVKGTDSFQHRVAMVVRWYQQTENEPRVPVYSDLHFGSPKNMVWSSYQKVSDIDKNTTMTLEVYDLEKNLLLKQEFHIQALQDEHPQLL